jgi:hypothetical protein
MLDLVYTLSFFAPYIIVGVTIIYGVLKLNQAIN